MSWLTTEDLERALIQHNDPSVLNAFQGIYPNNMLPTTNLHVPLFIVVNTDPHNLAGQHWKVIYINEDYCGEVFDSLALPLSNHVIQFMNRWTRSWRTNRTMFQHPSSKQCGVYVLYFITQRLKYSTLTRFCQSLSFSLLENERKMRAFYRTLQ